VLETIRDAGNDMKVRRLLARKVFDHTSRYDRAIADYFEKPSADALPPVLSLELKRSQALRYGENPDQNAAFYLEPNAPAHTLAGMKQLHGKELSFNKHPGYRCRRAGDVSMGGCKRSCLCNYQTHHALWRRAGRVGGSGL
jgi:AICAR transformylase/IMP cyclohydrolase PurH